MKQKVRVPLLVVTFTPVPTNLDTICNVAIKLISHVSICYLKLMKLFWMIVSIYV